MWNITKGDAKFLIYSSPTPLHMVEAQAIGVDMAGTELVAWLDDDNWWEPDHLETLVGLLDSTLSDFVWGSTNLWSPGGRLLHVRRDGKPRHGHIDTSEILFRRRCWERWGGLRVEDHHGADGKLIERWVAAGATYAHSNEVTLNYTLWSKEERRCF